MRAAIGLRLLLALTLLGWGQFGFAVDYYWTHTGSSTRFSSASAACTSLASRQFQPNASVRFAGSFTPVGGTTTSLYCNIEICYSGGTTCGSPTPEYVVPYNGNALSVSRSGDSCPAGATYDASKGECVAPEPPKDCSSHNGKFIVAGVSGRAAGNLYTTPSVVSIDGARYITAPDGNTRCKPNFDGSGTALCAVRYYGDGTCLPEGEASESDLSEGSYVEVEADTNGEDKCFNFGGSELCLSPDNAGCDIYKGTPWCYKTGDNCGEVNGSFVCFPKSSSRQCLFSNGKLECIETGNPPGSKAPTLIPPSSSDHPYNGGNADGNDKNDPKAPGTGDDTNYAGGGGPPTDLSQTNDELRGLGEKVDESNDLLGDILDVLNGEGEDDSGDSDGTPADAEAEGAAVGEAIADALTDSVELADEERNEEIEDVLNQIPNQVAQWFGADGSAVGLDFLHTIIPQPVACADYVIPFSLAGYSANLRLPVCALAPYKPILEWVIWCLTAIGAWRIAYSGLRQEDAKHARSGY
ncbi:hypothetical protein WG219_05110 [Ectopseudomonas mendocina]|uniref:Uncharacterized protein n=1 Tax=Ectopseudomonas mendocina TaxID=300 RepID=A0ABZ2RJB8_ECTME